MSEAPWLWLLAGPNGAGKSTYARDLSAIVDRRAPLETNALGLEEFELASAILFFEEKTLA